MPEPYDVDSLQRRLQLSEEWNMRLHAQIQDLLRLPRSELEAMRDRMGNPDIAIPLLQCYDAALVEKQEEIDRLLRDHSEALSQLDTAQRELSALRETAAAAEELTRELREAAQCEMSRADAARLESERAMSELRSELSRAQDAAASARRDASDLRAALATEAAERNELSAQRAAASANAQRAEAQLRQAARHSAQHADEGELQKVQLQLLSRENADKLEELERLRGRMVAALRNAAETHAAHMRVVEERHRAAVESLRAVIRAREMEAAQLRAAARVTAAVQSGDRGPMADTNEVVEAHARQQREAEVRRLAGELAAVRAQRDALERRVEAEATNARREVEAQHIERAQCIEALRTQLRDAAETIARQQRDMEALREEVRQLREAVAMARDEAAAMAQQRDEARRASDEARRQRARAETAAADSKEARDAAEAKLKEFELKELKEGGLQGLQGLQGLTGGAPAQRRAAEAIAAAEKARDEARRAAHAAGLRAAEKAREAAERSREAEAQRARAQRLEEAVRLNQRQAREADERVRQMAAQEEERTRQMREMTLVVERLKMEAARATRARDRLMEDMNTPLF